MVYCKFVDADVELKMLAPECDQYIKDGRCELCKTSEQIALGVKPNDLLRNIARG
jgi:hypothetical protein